jgi:hypothetical protein
VGSQDVLGEAAELTSQGSGATVDVVILQSLTWGPKYQGWKAKRLIRRRGVPFALPNHGTDWAGLPRVKDLRQGRDPS